jgi:uncharacterized protein (DUF305 family)
MGAHKILPLLLFVPFLACDPEVPGLPGAVDRTDVEGPDFSDARFLERMTEHHHRAIALAALGAERATRPELRELAAQIHRERHAELYEMLAWGPQWFDDVPNRDMDGIAADDRVVRAISEAPDFDAAWIDAMLANHAVGTELAQEGLRKADHAEVRALSQALLAEHDHSARQLRAWRLEWGGPAI